MDYDDNYGSHQFLLIDILKRTSNPILELGSGDYSTQQIHNLSEKRKVVTIDDSDWWIKRYLKLQDKYHRFYFMNNDQLEKFYREDNENWGLVFIDSGTWEQRTSALVKYKDVADYIILHDCDYMVGHKIFGTTDKNGLRIYNDLFRYWIEFNLRHKRDSPPTLLGSNKIDLKDIKIDGMSIISKNK